MNAMPSLRINARTNEVNGTAIRILKLYEDDAAPHADAYLKGLITNLTALSAQMSEAINMGRAQSDLDEADLERDAAIRSLFAGVEAFAMMVKTRALSEPALRLKAILDRYGLKMLRENYTTETSLVNALLSDLSAEQPAEDVAALPGVPAIVEYIRTAEEVFLAKQTAYEKAAAGHKNIPNPTSLKPQMLGLINDDIILHLRARKKSEPATFAALADAVAKAVADTNTAIKQRASKGKEDGKAEN